MKCNTVHQKLAGYLDDAATGTTRVAERGQIRDHLESCGPCREELQRFRKLSALMSRVPKHVPPANLAVRIKIAAARAQQEETWAGKVLRVRNRVEIVLDNVLRPLTLPATGGIFSAILIFVMVFQLIGPVKTVQAVGGDIPLTILRPAELLALSDSPQTWASEQHDSELSLPHGLLVDVTVDQHGQMTGYQILAGPNNIALRHELDQMLLFSSFRPMMSFGRPTAGGHVILSFSAVHVRG